METSKNKTKAELIAEIERLKKLSNSPEVKKEEGLLEKIAENCPNSYISIINKDLSIGFTSGQEFIEQGLNPDTFIGLSLEQVFAEHAPIVKKYYLKTFKGEEQTFELFTFNQWLLCKTFPLSNDSGKIESILVVVENITKRTQAEERLKVSAEKFRTVFENSPLGKSITGVDGSLEINKSFSDILGYSQQELKIIKWQDITHADDISKSIDIVKDLIDGKKERVQFEKRYIHKNGSIVWTDVITTLKRDKENKPEYFITTIQDITKRKMAEQAINESEVRYGELVNTINSGVAVYKVINDGKTGRDYIIQDFNKTALEWEGLEKTDVLGKTLIDIRPNIDEYGLLNIFEKVWKTGEPGFFPSKEYVDNKYANYYENRVFLLPNGNIVAVYDDVTERENAALLVKKSKERLDLAVNATKDGIYDWNLISNEIYYSPPWKRMLGYQENELPNDFSIWEKLTMPKDVERSWKMQQEMITKQRDRFEMEFKMKHKDGHWVDILSRAEAVFDDKGKAIRIVGTHVDISERKQAEKALKQSEAFNREIVDNSFDCINILDLKGNLEFMSKGGQKLLEIKNIKDYIGKSWFDLFTDKDRKLVLEAFKKAKSGDTGRFKSYIPTENGKPMWWDAIVTPIVDENGKLVSILAISRDITKETQIAIELKKSKDFIESIIEQSPSPMWISDENGTLISINLACTKLLDITAEAVIGKYNVLNDNLVKEQGYLPLVEDVFKLGKTARFELEYDTSQLKHVQLNGKVNVILDVTIFPVKDVTGKVTNAVIQHFDITERRQAEKAIKNSEYKYRVLIQNLPQRIFSKDRNHRYLTCNENFAGDLNLTPDDFVGKTDFDLYPKHLAEKYRKDDQRILKTGLTEELDEEYIQQGQKRIVHNVKTPMYNEDGDIIGIMGILWDVTEMKKAEEEINKLNQLLKETGRIAKIGGWEFDAETGKGTWTEEVARIHDLVPDEPTNMEKGTSFYTPESKSKIEKAIKNAIDNKSSFDLELEMTTAKGNHKWMHTIGKPIEKDGKIIRIHGSYQDITERKQFLKKLQERNEYIETLMGNMPIGFALNTIDDGDVKYVNDRFVEIYGWPRNKLSNTSIFFEKVFPDPEYREKMKTQIIADMQSGDPERMVWKDLKIVTSTGEMRFVDAHNIPLLNQNLMISTVQDTTKRKLAEDELKKHQEQLEEMVKERTRTLEDKNKELERFNNLFVDREIRIKELKEQIKMLEKEK